MAASPKGAPHLCTIGAMSDGASTPIESLATSVESLLRSLPERWTPFDHDDLTAAEQQVLLLLIAAGLVERRFTLRVEMAGQPGAFEATLAATGERGLADALEPMLAEMWSRWGSAFKVWKASEAASASPFRITHRGPDQWRLTEHGVTARGDLDIQAPSEGAAAFVGSFQRTIEFVTRTGRQADRPNVRGEGRLVELKTHEDHDDAKPTPSPVSLANPEELAAAFRDALIPGLVEALNVNAAKGEASSSPPTDPGRSDSGMPIEKVIQKAEAHVKAHRGVFPGRNKLAKIVGCSPASITKAVTRSGYLRARKAEHDAAKRGTSPERQTSQPLEDLAHDSDWKAAEADRDATLDKLIAEQTAEKRREEAQHKRARRRHEDD